MAKEKTYSVEYIGEQATHSRNGILFTKGTPKTMTEAELAFLVCGGTGERDAFLQVTEKVAEIAEPDSKTTPSKT